MNAPSNKKKNLIWILVDAVRNYDSGQDEYDKLEVMKQFGKESVEFRNVVSAAPSTIMALSSLMTSVPAYYLSRNFDDFFYDENSFPSLGNILKLKGYGIHGISFYFNARDKFKKIIYPVSSKFYPKGLNSYKHWSNDEVNSVLFNLLDSESELKAPFFLFVHYNARRDKGVSDKVRIALEKLRKKGYFENSIIVMNSDHGWPDPSRNKEFLKKIMAKGPQFHRHDLVLTDDNILSPLYIKYPGCKPCVKEGTVSSLDITPTLLDMFGFDFKSFGFHGKSTVPVIKGSKNEQGSIVRTDARYLGQTDRITSLRGDRFKYLYFHDIPGKDKDEFYDLEKDPHELKNISSLQEPEYKKALEEFRTEFKKQETEIKNYHERYLISKFNRRIKKYVSSKSNINSVLIYDSGSEALMHLLKKAVKSYFDSAKITILNNNMSNLQSLDTLKIDVVLIHMRNKTGIDYTQILKAMKNMKPKIKLFLDYNMNFYKKPQSKLNIMIKKFLRKKDQYKSRPGEIFRDMKRVLTNKIHWNSS